MEDTRAIYLIEKSGLSKVDKDFLRKHLETYNELINSLNARILQLNDLIDYGKLINDTIMSIKEKFIYTFREEKNKEELLKKIDFFLKYIENLEKQ